VEKGIKTAKAWLRNDWQLYALVGVPLLYFFIFKYLPIIGVLIAFLDFNMFAGIFGSAWVGLDNFREVFQMVDFWKALRNTFLLNAMDLFFGFPAPIILSLLLNELSIRWFKKISQTILYFPHFLSWVIIGGIATQVFFKTGVVNSMIVRAGGDAIPFLTEKWHWLAIYISVGIWQNLGWGTIIYLAALAGVNKELYEAASIDGAGRFRKLWNISLPGIKPTVILMLVLSVGKIASIGFDRPFVLGNAFVVDFSDVISTYVYRIGLQAGRFNIATAVGLFQSVVGLVFLLSAEGVVRKSGEQGLL
jgi:putative aldouronate transport system permease protein